MKTASIIFPHQLFKHNPALQKEARIILVEETLFFNQYSFHKQKILLHRASMQFYKDYLSGKNWPVEYIESHTKASDIRELVSKLAKEGIKNIHYTDTTDNWLEKRITCTAEKKGIKLYKYDNPGFLNTTEELHSFFDQKKRYFQTEFYIWQRKKRKTLLHPDGNPEGGKWSFDADNRQRMPKTVKPPPLPQLKTNKYISEAVEYVSNYFPGNYGFMDSFIYPVTHDDALLWLEDFLTNRLQHFGKYEDAMVVNEKFLFHSVLTPALNIGLLLPGEVLEKTMTIASKLDIPLNSLEGFIRQVNGWREFIRAVYEREGSVQRTKNYWGFNRKIPPSFWTGSTGIAPIDIVIKKILATGYTHHIERLMVLGNFMLLCEFDPDEVYHWFMELFIDSYDWVMVPNIYGMTQFADGGLMTSKPYISSSNYLLKMGDWPKGEWQIIWDSLFWRFIHLHRNYFQKNPRLGLMVNTFDKMPDHKKEALLVTGNRYLENLDKEIRE